MRKWLLAAMLVPCMAPAQMTLYVASQATERAVGDYYDVGTVAVDGFVETAFRVRNSSSAPAWLTGLNIGSSGKGIGQFTFKTLPQLPVQLDPAASIDFAVRFSPSAPDSWWVPYRGALLFPSSILIGSILTGTDIATSPLGRRGGG